jgi:hypothetical protein
MLQEDCFGRKSNANRIIEAGFSRLELASKAENWQTADKSDKILQT